MIDELEPVWKQFAETCEALRLALAAVPDARLPWRPGPKANTVAGIVQHIARGNHVYARMMEHSDPGPRGAAEERPSRQQLLDRLESSEQQVREQFERTVREALREPCADSWRPLGPEAKGPHDALWFAMQIVRHTAYHLGQINVYLLIWEGEGSP